MPTNAPVTRNQLYAERAYQYVCGVRKEKQEEFKRFAMSFPALVHGCGLSQALAFAKSKKHDDVLEGVVRIMEEDRGKNVEDLLKMSRTADLVSYLRLSRNVLNAAGWLKRYSEAVFEE